MLLLEDQTSLCPALWHFLLEHHKPCPGSQSMLGCTCDGGSPNVLGKFDVTRPSHCIGSHVFKDVRRRLRPARQHLRSGPECLQLGQSRDRWNAPLGTKSIRRVYCIMVQIISKCGCDVTFRMRIPCDVLIVCAQAVSFSHSVSAGRQSI